MPNWCTTPWTKQLEQWLRWTKTKHKDIAFHAMLLNNCLCFRIVTILSRQTLFESSLHLKILNWWSRCQIYRHMWMKYWDLRWTDAHLSDSPELQNCGRQTGSGHECEEKRRRERERERAPGKLPWLCLQQKAIVWCGRTAGSKAPAPTGCALGKMPDGGHCWMTSTSPY